MPTVPLRAQTQIQLDPSGAGTARLGPVSAREVWHPQNASVQVSTDNREAVCNIYVGDTDSPWNFRDATSSGSIGDSTDRVSADEITCGHYVFAVWTGGDPNAYAQLVVTGSKDV